MTNGAAYPANRKTLILVAVLILGFVIPSCAKTATPSKTSVSSLFRKEVPGPQNLTLTPGDGKIDLTWQVTADADVTGYEIWRWASGEIPKPFKELPAGILAYSDTSLTNGTTYHYLVLSKYKSGDISEVQNIACACPVVLPPPVVTDNSSGSGSGGTYYSGGSSGSSGGGRSGGYYDG